MDNNKCIGEVTPLEKTKPPGFPGGHAYALIRLFN